MSITLPRGKREVFNLFTGIGGTNSTPADEVSAYVADTLPVQLHRLSRWPQCCDGSGGSGASGVSGAHDAPVFVREVDPDPASETSTFVVTGDDIVAVTEVVARLLRVGTPKHAGRWPASTVRDVMEEMGCAPADFVFSTRANSAGQVEDVEEDDAPLVTASHVVQWSAIQLRNWMYLALGLSWATATKAAEVLGGGKLMLDCPISLDTLLIAGQVPSPAVATIMDAVGCQDRFALDTHSIMAWGTPSAPSACAESTAIDTPDTTAHRVYLWALCVMRCTDADARAVGVSYLGTGFADATTALAAGTPPAALPTALSLPGLLQWIREGVTYGDETPPSCAPVDVPGLSDIAAARIHAAFRTHSWTWLPADKSLQDIALGLLLYKTAW